MRYVITDTSIIRISETFGTIQNLGRDKIELSDSANFFNVFLLYPLNQVSFNKPLFIRGFDNGAKSFNIPVNVVQFINDSKIADSGLKVASMEDFTTYLDTIFPAN